MASITASFSPVKLFLWPLVQFIDSLKADPLKHFGAACIATSFAFFVLAPPLISWEMSTAWALLFGGYAFSGFCRPSLIPLAGGTLILLSALATIPLTYGGIWFEQTVVLALLTAIVYPLLFVDNPRIWDWMVPVWVVHIGWSLVDVFTFPGRLTGLADNANIGSTFLLLGCIYLTNGNTRLKWLIIPLAAVMPYTGSRWATLVLIGIMAAIFGLRSVPWKYLAVVLVVVIGAITFTTWPLYWEKYDRPNTLAEHMGLAKPMYAVAPVVPEAVDGDTAKTVKQTNQNLSLIPQGFWDSGIHNVPWRMAHETGILSALAWLGVTGYALVKDRGSTRWWMLLTVALISVMYYHTWIGALGGFWWLLVNPVSHQKGSL